MSDQEWIGRFRAAAAELYPTEPEFVERLIAMERDVTAPRPYNVVASHRRYSADDVKAWETVRRQLSQPVPGGSAGIAKLAGASERIRTIHNERVKLNAAFLNSLAVWFAGAGTAGVAINTVLTNGIHRLERPLELGLGGFAIAGLLKWLANREVGKLR